jgi:hypothetical protein
MYAGGTYASNIASVGGVGATAAGDVLDKQTSVDFSNRKASVGQDTIVSLATFLAGRLPIVGVSLASGGAQVFYDALRLYGPLPPSPTTGNW